MKPADGRHNKIRYLSYLATGINRTKGDYRDQKRKMQGGKRAGLRSFKAKKHILRGKTEKLTSWR